MSSFSSLDADSGVPANFGAFLRDPTASPSLSPSPTGSSASAASADISLTLRGDGRSTSVKDEAGAVDSQTRSGTALEDGEEVKLNQFLATGICGNDILGSCLYAAGLVAVPAGRWAPVCFFLVGALLYFFRWIYQEVGQALPVNGGTYTLLLNTSSKQIAAFAGSLTLLSYVATAVVSANSAMHYLRELWPDLQVYSAVVLLLFVFAVINLVGIRESAYNALLIFAIHLVTLLVFLAACLARVIDDGGVTLMANLATPPDQGDFFALAYGFCVALLGVTGFETSANYIEAQARGVYPRVLRNVCVLVIVVNPLISLLSMGVLPQDLVPGIKNHLVSSAAYAAQGRWLHVLVTLDAVLVLSGSVLTAFIGVQGLAYRMALDGCLPRALTSLSHMRGTQHVSVLAFFLVAVSLHVLCDADIRVLSGVYTLSFVALLVCFVFGNIWLNVSRAALPRESASRAAVAVALIGTVFGLLGTAYSQPDMAMYAVVYVGAVFAVVLACLYWLLILRGAASVLSVLGVGLGSRMKLVEQIAREQHKGIVFFLQNETNDDLRQVCRYVLANEERRLLKIVKVTSEPLSPAELSSLRVRIDALAAEVSMWTATSSLAIANVPAGGPGHVGLPRGNSGIGLSSAAAGAHASNAGGGDTTDAEAPLLGGSSSAAGRTGSTLSSSASAALVAGPAAVIEAPLELLLEAEVGALNAELVDRLHARWSVPPNFMFVACPTNQTPWDYASLKGVRIIIEGSAAATAAAAAAASAAHAKAAAKLGLKPSDPSTSSTDSFGSVGLRTAGREPGDLETGANTRGFDLDRHAAGVSAGAGGAYGGDYNASVAASFGPGGYGAGAYADSTAALAWDRPRARG